ncbi:MAG: hypothetical protein DSY80_00550, partial [Desulfocapsa sp.]
MTMTKKQKFIGALKRAPFTIAAAGAWTASAGFNALTGASMGGDDPVQTIIWLIAAISLDMLKAGGAIKLTAALNNRRFGLASVAAGLMIIGTAVSLLSALTMRANVAAGSDAGRQKIIETRAAIKADIANAKASLRSVQYARLIATVEADIQKAQRHKRWRMSEQCSNATVEASIAFCNKYNALSAEKTAAATRINLQIAIVSANRRLAAIPMPKASSSPVAKTVGTILASAGIEADPTKVADWIMIFMTIAIEFGAVAGPALAFNGQATPKKKKHRIDMKKMSKQQRVIYLASEMEALDGRAPSKLELARAADCNPATVTRALQ